MKMLYTQRRAVELMPAWWRPVHRLLWALYWPRSGSRVVRSLWFAYRERWPVRD